MNLSMELPWIYLWLRFFWCVEFGIGSIALFAFKQNEYFYCEFGVTNILGIFLHHALRSTNILNHSSRFACPICPNTHSSTQVLFPINAQWQFLNSYVCVPSMVKRLGDHIYPMHNNDPRFFLAQGYPFLWPYKNVVVTLHAHGETIHMKNYCYIHVFKITPTIMSKRTRIYRFLNNQSLVLPCDLRERFSITLSIHHVVMCTQIQ